MNSCRPAAEHWDRRNPRPYAHTRHNCAGLTLQVDGLCDVSTSPHRVRVMRVRTLSRAEAAAVGAKEADQAAEAEAEVLEAEVGEEAEEAATGAAGGHVSRIIAEDPLQQQQLPEGSHHHSDHGEDRGSAGANGAAAAAWRRLLWVRRLL